MTPDNTPEARGWRRYLPSYGVVPATAAVDESRRERHVRHVREERQRRGGLLGWLVALCIGAGIAVVAVNAMRDPRSLGAQLDDAVASVRHAGNEAGQTLSQSPQAVTDASQGVVADVKSSLSDAAISMKIKTALAADPALKASSITVETTNGVVRLEGPAPDATAKERATVLASAPQGVRSVDNRLTLPGQAGAAPSAMNATPTAVPSTALATPVPAASAATPEDAALGRRVEAALARDTSLAKVSVNAQQGTVRLQGVVPDAAAKERAVALANSQPGVASVDNRLLTNEAATLLARNGTEP